LSSGGIGLLLLASLGLQAILSVFDYKQLKMQRFSRKFTVVDLSQCVALLKLLA
jgi:hypothetical protein